MDEIFEFETIKGSITKFKKVNVYENTEKGTYFQIFSEMSNKSIRS